MKSGMSILKKDRMLLKILAKATTNNLFVTLVFIHLSVKSTAKT